MEYELSPIKYICLILKNNMRHTSLCEYLEAVLNFSNVLRQIARYLPHHRSENASKTHPKSSHDKFKTASLSKCGHLRRQVHCPVYICSSSLPIMCQSTVYIHSFTSVSVSNKQLSLKTTCPFFRESGKQISVRRKPFIRSNTKAGRKSSAFKCSLMPFI